MSAIRTSFPNPVDDILDLHGGDHRAAIAALLQRLDEAKAACSAGYSRRRIVRPPLRPWIRKAEETDVEAL